MECVAAVFICLFTFLLTSQITFWWVCFISPQSPGLIITTRDLYYSWLVIDDYRKDWVSTVNWLPMQRHNHQQFGRESQFTFWFLISDFQFYLAIGVGNCIFAASSYRTGGFIIDRGGVISSKWNTQIKRGRAKPIAQIGLFVYLGGCRILILAKQVKYSVANEKRKEMRTFC